MVVVPLVSGTQEAETGRSLFEFQDTQGYRETLSLKWMQMVLVKSLGWAAHLLHCASEPTPVGGSLLPTMASPGNAVPKPVRAPP